MAFFLIFSMVLGLLDQLEIFSQFHVIKLLAGLILESNAMLAIFQERDKKRAKKGKVWAKMYKI